MTNSHYRLLLRLAWLAFNGSSLGLLVTNSTTLSHSSRSQVVNSLWFSAILFSFGLLFDGTSYGVRVAIFFAYTSVSCCCVVYLLALNTILSLN